MEEQAKEQSRLGGFAQAASLFMPVAQCWKQAVCARKVSGNRWQREILDVSGRRDLQDLRGLGIHRDRGRDLKIKPQAICGFGG
jgi:hypothetical protein